MKVYPKYLKLFSKLILPSIDNVALTFHDIPHSHFDWFKNIIDELMKEYKFINPYNLSSSLKKNKIKPNLLLTFDDGFSSNIDICKDILEPRGIKALFFIPSYFINLKGYKAYKFCQEYFFPKTKIPFTKKYDSLTIDQIKEMIYLGNYIGGHTKTHPNLKTLKSNNLFEEIIESSNYLESILDYKIIHFAYPFGSIETISKEAFDITKSKFKYCFSNIRGGLTESPSHHFLYRQNIDKSMPFFIVKSIIQGKLNWKYNKERYRAISEFKD